MVYMKIGKKKYECSKATVFHTQTGQLAVRIISDTAPATNKGFLLLDENDNEIADRSTFTHLYREQGTVKEYTEQAEEILPAEGYKSGIPVSQIDRQLASINSRITSITPYEETKTAYFGEIEKVFYGVPNGVLTVHMDDDFTVQKVEDRVYIHFDRLTTNKEITITVQ